MALSPNHSLRREAPRITANELARYMVASETGKIGIIRRARESVTPQRVRYSDVRKAIRAHLGDNARPRSILNTARDRFEQRKDDSSLGPFAREDASLSLDVLDSLGRMQNQLGGIAFRGAPVRQGPVMLSGMEVAVNVDLLVSRSRDGVEQIGGALFRFTKADEESEGAAAKRRDMGMYAATLVHLQVAQNLAGNHVPHYQLCMSVDVQAEEIHYAPRSYAQRAQNLENACRFIRAMWDQA